MWMPSLLPFLELEDNLLKRVHLSRGSRPGLKNGRDKFPKARPPEPLCSHFLDRALDNGGYPKGYNVTCEGLHAFFASPSIALDIFLPTLWVALSREAGDSR